ncbi:MAG: hypothetical protein IPG63_06035 [Xanthomonadales bacterium]|nr:hypothetical protein [Xanthomonadales bacterium]MBK7143828.1 hypothetical protein [Xanthomonadales bacterium]MCC6562185.1 hypothetical protein [Xanthomonadales bacterium]
MAEHDRDDDTWTQRIRSELETSARDLDAATLSRLNQARQQALQAAATPRPRAWLWPTTLATAFSLALAIALWPQLVPEAVPVPTAALPDDFPMLAEGDGLELYEDLDFYAWLDAQPASG